MKRRLWTTTSAAVAAAVLIAGCGDTTGGSSSEARAEQILVWDQARHPGLGKPGPDGSPALHTRLLDTAGQRAEALAQLPASVPAAERATVEGVDLTTHVIVLGVYSTCTEVGRVAVTDESLRFVVENPEPDTRCVWAPRRVEVWSVDRRDLMEPILFLDQSGNTPTT